MGVKSNVCLQKANAYLKKLLSHEKDFQVCRICAVGPDWHITYRFSDY